MQVFEAIIRDRGSIYAVAGGPCHSDADAKEFVRTLRKRKKFARATHHSWAVVTSGGALKNDDGEGGAGMVILRMLQREGILNEIVVVTRWFGGTHLGGDRFRHVREAVRIYLERRE